MVRLPAHFRSHFESSTVYKSTYFDYLRTYVKLVNITNIVNGTPDIILDKIDK